MQRGVAALYLIVLALVGCSTSRSEAARSDLPRARDQQLERSLERRKTPTLPANAGVELSPAEKARVLADPLHAQARMASSARAAERASGLAAKLDLAPDERTRFVEIFAENHQAKLSIIEFHKQHRNLSREAFEERVQAVVPADVLARASAASVHAQVSNLLGKDRYAQYLEALERRGDVR
jgi:hypothetical protein